MSQQLLTLLAQLGAAALETDRALGAADHAAEEPIAEMEADCRARGRILDYLDRLDPHEDGVIVLVGDVAIARAIQADGLIVIPRNRVHVLTTGDSP